MQVDHHLPHSDFTKRTRVYDYSDEIMLSD